MRKALYLLPLCIALAACGPTGCDTLRPLLDPHSVTQGQKIDEQLLGGAVGAAALANVSITRAAPFMTESQVLEAQKLKRTYDQAIADATVLKTKLDVDGYKSRIEAAQTAIAGVTNLLKNVRN